jgi:signal transduction histidine kinase
MEFSDSERAELLDRLARESQTRSRERIFEPYAGSHSRPGVAASVGLGLAVSRRLTKLMAGDLVYDSTKRAGKVCSAAPFRPGNRR